MEIPIQDLDDMDIEMKYDSHKKQLNGGDRTAAMVYARQVLEAIVNNLCACKKIPFDEKTSLFDKINLLYKAQAISSTSMENYHRIRKDTNDAVHGIMPTADNVSYISNLLDSELLIYLKDYGDRMADLREQLRQEQEAKQAAREAELYKQTEALLNDVKKWAIRIGAGILIAIGIIFVVVKINASNQARELEAATQAAYQQAIEDFSPEAYNTKELIVGEEDDDFLYLYKPVYSTDDSVVTVTRDKTVLAVGPGTAYVVCARSIHSAKNIKADCYEYVVSPVESDQQPTQPDKPIDGQKNEPSPSLPSTPQQVPEAPEVSGGTNTTAPTLPSSPIEPPVASSQPNSIPSSAPIADAFPEDVEDWVRDALDTWNSLPSDNHRGLKSATLSVGDTHTPQAASVWTISKVYSTNEDVVTVAADGTVTAVGAGSAMVMLQSSTGTVDCYRYTVE